MRRTLRIGTVFVIAVAVLVSRVLWLRWVPGPRIDISRGTTYITEPLSEDGLPDYVAYLQRKYGQVAVPKNNAAVPIWQAVGPSRLPERVRQEWFNQLGIESLPVDAEYHRPLDDAAFVAAGAQWLANFRESQSNLANNDQLQGEAARKFEELIEFARQRPWTAKRLPVLGEWIQGNQRSLDLAREASMRSQYCSPLVSTGRPAILNMLSETERQTRELARGLALRAMWHIGENRFPEAQKNTLAIHRLARLVGQRPNNVVDYLVAISIDYLACKTHTALASDPGAPRVVLQMSLDELRAMKRWADSPNAIDEGERLMALDTILGIYRDANAVAGLGQLGDFLSGFVRGGSVDWNIVLRQTNSSYDDIVEAMRLSDRGARSAAAEGIDHELVSMKYGYSWKVRSALSRKARSQLIAHIFQALLFPAGESFAQAEERANMQLDLTTTALALAVYRARHGTYPRALNELVPEIVEAVPEDLYVDAPLRYEIRGEGYLLYSVFTNGRDDGGTNLDGTIVDGEWSNEEADVHGDNCDLVIRVPMPPLKVP